MRYTKDKGGFLTRDHGFDASHALGSAGINIEDSGVREGTAQHATPQHIGNRYIHRKNGLTRNLDLCINPGNVLAYKV
jgi:hypothetical protein